MMSVQNFFSSNLKFNLLDHNKIYLCSVVLQAVANFYQFICLAYLRPNLNLLSRHEFTQIDGINFLQTFKVILACYLHPYIYKFNLILDCSGIPIYCCGYYKFIQIIRTGTTFYGHFFLKFTKIIIRIICTVCSI